MQYCFRSQYNFFSSLLSPSIDFVASMAFEEIVEGTDMFGEKIAQVYKNAFFLTPDKREGTIDRYYLENSEAKLRPTL